MRDHCNRIHTVFPRPFLLLPGCGSWLVLLAFMAISSPAPATSTSDDVIVLKPTNGTGPQAAMILFPAQDMLPSQYLPLMNATSRSSSIPLWMAVVSMGGSEGKVPTPQDIGAAVETATELMVSQGLTNPAPLFLGVHSQSYGSVVQDYVASTPQGVTGLVLLGAFLKRVHRGAPPYPVPTLTVGGGMDGVCRVSRIMEEYIHRIHTAKNRTEAIKHFPVTVIPGMSHLQFASGPPSDLIKMYDLKAEIKNVSAHNMTSLVVSSFIEFSLHGSSSRLRALELSVNKTGRFLQPLIEAYTLEGSYQFKPPCHEDPPSAACQVGCPWTEEAMSAMAALKEVKINDTDGFHPASEIFPRIHHPEIFSQCPMPNSSCVVSLSSVSQNIYYKDSGDTGLVPNSACEIRGKLKSRQSVMLAAGFKNVDFNESDAGSLCRKINQLAYDWALNHSEPSARERFMKYGVPIVMGEDKGSMHNGGLWIYLPMEYTQTTDSNKQDVLAVSSIQLKTSIQYPIGMFQGMHFCKLLSPAKVMEWIYVDGLRARLSLAQNRAKLMSCGL